MAKSGKRKVKRVILIVLLCITLLAVIIITPFIIKISKMKSQADAMVAASSDATFKSDKTTLIYDCNGQKIANMLGEKVMYYRDLEDIPKDLQNAFIVMEDKKFYEHRGVDFFAVVRAVLANYNANEIEQGASTITQQLARNVFLNQEVTWQRKIQEMYVALALERTYSKDKILEYYLNNIYFSNGYYGVEAAANGYFGCSASELTLSQQVFISAIPNNPSKYDPLVNLENTVSRRNLILEKMYEDKVITQTAYETALAEEIVINRPQVRKYNSVETYVKYCATRELMRQRGFEFRYEFSSDEDYNYYMEGYHSFYSRCQQELFAGGYAIYTSIDMDKQQILQDKIDTVLSRDNSVNQEGVYQFQGAAVTIDNATGNVVAIVGSRSQELEGYTLNRAYQSHRQPGSAIKPISVYLPYLIAGNYPSSMVKDEPIQGGPVNYDGLYMGEITATDALRFSRNTPAWRIYEELTPRNCMSYLFQQEFKKVYMDKNNMSGAIGGHTYGVTAEEMAGAYATIANDGIFRYTTCVSRIEDAAGEPVVDTSKRGTQVYPKNESLMMKQMLKKSHTDGTANHATLDSAIAGSKTGTTNNDWDYWYVGFTHYYTTSVWIGYDTPKTISVWGEAATIFKMYMDEIHRNLAVVDFADYDHTKENEYLKVENESSSSQAETESSDTPDIPYEPSTDVIGESDGTLPYEPPVTPGGPGEWDGQGTPGEWDGSGSSGEWNGSGSGGEWDAPAIGGDRPASGNINGEWDAN